MLVSRDVARSCPMRSEWQWRPAEPPLAVIPGSYVKGPIRGIPNANGHLNPGGGVASSNTASDLGAVEWILQVPSVTSGQVTLALLVRGPHFGNHRPTVTA